jgi:hypothetical protein
VRRSFAYAMPFLALPLAAAACGGSKSSSNITVTLSADPATAVKDAAAKTTQAGSEHVAILGRVVGGQGFSFKGTGDFDTKKRVGSLKADFTGGGLNGSVVEISNGTTAYLKSDLLSAFVPGGKTWVKVDLAKAGASAGVLSALLPEDPLKALDELQSLQGVTKVGTAEIGGVSTTHYRGRLDLSTLTGTKMVGRGRFDVWIGDDGYVHRVRAVVAPKGTVSTVTSDLSKFGEPVSASVPSAADTFDATNTKIPGLGG